MYIVIAGGGKVGRNLTNQLLRQPDAARHHGTYRKRV